MRHIPSLDGLRAISITLVIIGHAYNTVPSHTPATDMAAMFLGNANLGVTTFFVISGYLITRLLRGEQERLGHISLRGFYFRRVLRIFPAFYLYIATIAVLVALGVLATTGRSILAAGSFLLNYCQFWDPGAQSARHFWFVGHFWTLALEEQFYLLWPLALVSVGLGCSRRLAFAILVVCPVLRVLTYLFWPEGRNQTALMLPTAADSMMAGAVLALSEGNARFEAWVARLSLPLAAFGALLVVGILSPLLLHRFMGAYDLPVGRSVNALAIAVILIYVTRSSDSWMGRVLNCRIAVFTGTISYSLYLWQQLFLTPLNQTWTGLFPCNLGLSLVAAMVSHYVVERPFMRLKERRAGP